MLSKLHKSFFLPVVYNTIYVSAWYFAGRKHNNKLFILKWLFYNFEAIFCQFSTHIVNSNDVFLQWFKSRKRVLATVFIFLFGRTVASICINDKASNVPRVWLATTIHFPREGTFRSSLLSILYETFRCSKLNG